MSQTGLSTFDQTLKATHTWLKSLMQKMEWEDRQRAYHGLRAVLHALRDQLTLDEITDFAAQLPMLVRGFFYEGWKPSSQAKRAKTREAFLKQVERSFSSPERTETVVRAVFEVIAEHISEGEVEDIKQLFTPELRDLWPEEYATLWF